MGGLFSGGSSSPPPAPRVVRMPTESDPSVLAAQRRAREAALRRHGRSSTVLTDTLRLINGSAGKLGD